MVGTVGLIVVALAYVRWRKRINTAMVITGTWVYRFLVDPKTCGIASTFCNEVAVLWFVFPLLDTIYEHGKRGDPLLRQAFKISGLFFVFAIVLSHIAGKQDKED